MEWVRAKGWMLGMVIGWLVQAGCTNSVPLVSGGSLSSMPAESADRPGELPRAKALQACLAVAQRLDKNGEDNLARQEYEKVLQLDPNNMIAARRLAVIYDRAAAFDKADAAYRMVAKAYPNDADLLSDWGYSYYLQNKWKDAEERFRQALKVNPQHTRAQCNLGLSLGQQGRYQEAFQAFRNAQLTEAATHSNLAYIYCCQGKLDEGRRECRQALSLDKSCAQAQQLLAMLDHPPGQRSNPNLKAPPRSSARPDSRLVTRPESSSTSSGNMRLTQVETGTGTPPVNVQEGLANTPPVAYRSPNGMGWVPIKRPAQQAPAVPQPQQQPSPSPAGDGGTAGTITYE